MYSFRQLLLAVVSCSLIACTATNNKTPDKEPDYSYFAAVTDSATISAKELLTGILGDNYSKLATALAGKLPAVRADVISYNSVDPQGKPLLLSGAVTYPLDVPFKGVVLAEHYTIGANSEAPSSAKGSVESSLSALGYVVISPDYIGFGQSRSLPHPYLHAECTATASIDMLFAVREYFNSKEQPLGDAVSIIGYSQGGASALATQKYAEEKYGNAIHINKVIAGAGPYDLAMLFDALRYRLIPQSAFVPMILIGLNCGDGLNLDFSKIFKEPLLSSYNDWIVSKKYTESEISAKLGDDFIQPDFLDTDRESEEVQTLRASLLHNSLTAHTPKAPVRLLHGTNDTTVPYSCSEAAYNAFKANGCQVELVPFPGFDHGGAVAMYILDVMTHL